VRWRGLPGVVVALCRERAVRASDGLAPNGLRCIPALVITGESTVALEAGFQ
jgi:hypothetical protein